LTCGPARSWAFTGARSTWRTSRWTSRRGACWPRQGGAASPPIAPGSSSTARREAGEVAEASLFVVLKWGPLRASAVVEQPGIAWERFHGGFAPPRRFRMRRASVIFPVALAVALSAPGLAPAQSKEPVKIGLSAAVSGGSAASGEAIKRGLLIA